MSIRKGLYSIIHLLLLFVTVSLATSRHSILNCIKELVDNDSNNIITERELDHFIETNKCIPDHIEPFITGKMVINTCDLNGDHLLTIYDWSFAHNCINIEFLTRLCKRCFNQSKL